MVSKWKTTNFPVPLWNYLTQIRRGSRRVCAIMDLEQSDILQNLENSSVWIWYISITLWLHQRFCWSFNNEDDYQKQAQKYIDDPLDIFYQEKTCVFKNKAASILWTNNDKSSKWRNKLKHSSAQEIDLLFLNWAQVNMVYWMGVCYCAQVWKSHVLTIAKINQINKWLLELCGVNHEMLTKFTESKGPS